MEGTLTQTSFIARLPPHSSYYPYRLSRRSLNAAISRSDIQQDQNPCPNSPLAAIHTRDRDDVKGCALVSPLRNRKAVPFP
jgi:hypothetical protein